jgi:hypothetical protein
MHTLKNQLRNTMLVAILLPFAGSFGRAQTTAPSNVPDAAAPSPRSIEDLNYLGGDVAMPPFADSIVDVNSGFRQALFSKGMALRVISMSQFVQNTLAAPVPADQQVYVGHHPFGNVMIQPILSADLRQLHLNHAQFYAGSVWNWVSWNPAGPKAFQLWDLYFYKEFGKDRVEMKAG